MKVGDILICKKEYYYSGVGDYTFKKYNTYLYNGRGINPNTRQKYYLIRSNLEKNRSMGFSIESLNEHFYLNVADKIKKYNASK